MVKLVFLGTANAIPDESHDHTHLALLGENHAVLIDSGSNLVTRLHQAHIDIFKITDLILTHFHPDHVSGVPSFLVSSWLLGRQEPLNIYGSDYTLTRVERMLELFNWRSWPNFFGVNFCWVAESDLAPVLKNEEFTISASPVCHMVPNVGIRVEIHSTGRVIAYSSDTEPCPAVVRLAAGADILIHEASGEGLGHTSAAQAGQIAAQAKVGQLYLIHYPVGGADPAPWLKEARQVFWGPVTLAEDLMEVEL